MIEKLKAERLVILSAIDKTRCIHSKPNSKCDICAELEKLGLEYIRINNSIRDLTNPIQIKANKLLKKRENLSKQDIEYLVEEASMKFVDIAEKIGMHRNLFTKMRNRLGVKIDMTKIFDEELEFDMTEKEIEEKQKAKAQYNKYLAIAMKNDINPTTFWSRVKTFEWEMEKAATTKVDKGSKYAEYQIKCSENRVPWPTFNTRRRAGWPLEEACSVPPGGKRWLVKA